VGGSPLASTATAGTLALKDANGKLRANVFFVAYTKDEVPAGGRPIAFVFHLRPSWL
jgi:carboxypeptidase C (cathepsin A)